LSEVGDKRACHVIQMLNTRSDKEKKFPMVISASGGWPVAFTRG